MEVRASVVCSADGNGAAGRQAKIREAIKPAGTEASTSSEPVHKIFEGPHTGDGAAFFGRVADDVDWTVMGTQHSPVTTLAKRQSLKASPTSWDAFLSQSVQLRVEELLCQT
jgi:hypothetical protein